MVVYVNAEGCSNACVHCSVIGHPPYGDFYSKKELLQIAQEWGPIWPHFEVTAHSEFPDILDPNIVGYESVSPIPTNGFGLAERDDYEELFSKMHDRGITGVSFTLHGLKKNHDRFASREGAFQTIMTAGRMAAEHNFSIHWNIFVDQRNTEDIPPLVDIGKREFGLKSFWFAAADPIVSPRGLHYEKIRPRLADAQRVLSNLDPAVVTGPLKNQTCEEFTEAALLKRWQEDPKPRDLMLPWEPKSWPPGPLFQNGIIMIESDRNVFFNPVCGEFIQIGMLSDGKEEIMRRIQSLSAPRYYNITAAQAKELLSEDDAKNLHGAIGSVRLKAINIALYGGYVN